MSVHTHLIRILVFLIGLGCALIGIPVLAQVGGPYENTTVGVINGTTNCGGGEFTRLINVPPSDIFVVGDLDVGFLASHTWRGDIRLDLESPTGTVVRLINDDTSAAGNPNNVNVRMDDSAATVIYTPPHNTNDGLVAPPYENLVSPHNPLSAFNGEDPAGDWILTICDNFPGADNGQFRRANLYFTGAIGADLSILIDPSDPTPNIGTNVFLNIIISHNGTVTADGITADITLPSGLSYVSDNGAGAYNSGTGLWTVPGSLLNNSTSLQITAFVNASGAFNIISEIATSNQADPDSTPGNGVTTEDDYDTLTLAPVTPTVPTLSCPGAPNILNWDRAVWGEGDLTNSYTVAGEPIVITVTDVNGSLQNYAPFGGQTPIESTANTGGLTPAESSVHFLADQPTQASTVDISIALGTFGTGVEQFQMSIFDVDFGAAQFEDQITVLGTIGGVTVTPTLFTSAANTASGSVVTGISGAGSTSGVGNMTIEFNAPIDTLVINYGNGPGAPANPGNQGIAMHDLSICPVLTAVLKAEKTAAVFDPLSEGLYMVPGNDVIYTIEFVNGGDGPTDANSLEIIDAVPSEIEFYNGDIDDGGPETQAVTGTDFGSGLLPLNFATDVRFSTSATQPANFLACADTPSAGYDPSITFICVNPKGSMAAGSPDPSYQVKFRARIK